MEILRLFQGLFLWYKRQLKLCLRLRFFVVFQVSRAFYKAVFLSVEIDVSNPRLFAQRASLPKKKDFSVHFLSSLKLRNVIF